ncbi:hypothetical protein BDR06DRAFT_1032453 [Suillus hirtellus]|nr:hypothetical protein BDR06DRAFT_1032453 [Suillus hirtellus]
MMQQVAKDHDDFNITLRWIPGHSNVHGNDKADKHAKLAAEGQHNNSPPDRLPRSLCHQTLPLSISALKE